MMIDIDQLNLDEQLKHGTTRRTVLATGAKLAYAVPLVAATVSLTTSGALAVCGVDNPFPFESGGNSLCCGCCRVAPSFTGDEEPDPITQAFIDCQALLAENDIECPLAGEEGSDETVVCIAPDVAVT